MKRRTLVVQTGLVGLGAMAGCTPSSPPVTGVSPSSVPATVTASGAVPTFSTPAETTAAATGSPTAAPSSSAVTGGPFATAGASAPAGSTGSGYHIAVVRVGGHDTYDRVVVELARGTGRPAWAASYVPEFVTQGEGRPVTLPGAGHLEVRVRGLAMPQASDTVVKGDLGLRSGSVQGVYVDPWMEGQALVMIGLDSVRGYRVTVEEGPTRVVVDVQR